MNLLAYFIVAIVTAPIAAFSPGAHPGINRKPATINKLLLNAGPVQKDEEYYKDLGYDSLMEGVVGEAEKEGKGDKIAKELEEFKKQSQIKAFSVIGVSLATLFYLKIQFDSDPSNFIGGH